VADLPTPEPAPGEVRVAVHAAAVNPVDWKVREGYLAQFLPLEFPAALGSELAGVVDAVGEGVDGLAVGDAVFASTGMRGAIAEYAVVPAASLAHTPEGVSFADAAALPIAGGTAVVALELLGLKAGQTVLVNGAGGGVGVLTVQLARQAGLDVIGTAGPGKKELVESLGATHVAYGDGVVDRVRAVRPEGVDGIIDLAGGDALRAVAGLAADPAKILSAGDPVTAGELGGSSFQGEPTPARLTPLVALVAEGRLTPGVTQTFPLAQAAEALAVVESGHATGKVVVSLR
jgi:NADPH:quinone reductase-like Zn-dependent oxidoreductase